MQVLCIYSYGVYVWSTVEMVHTEEVSSPCPDTLLKCQKHGCKQWGNASHFHKIINRFSWGQKDGEFHWCLWLPSCFSWTPKDWRVYTVKGQYLQPRHWITSLEVAFNSPLSLAWHFIEQGNQMFYLKSNNDHGQTIGNTFFNFKMSFHNKMYKIIWIVLIYEAGKGELLTHWRSCWCWVL